MDNTKSMISVDTNVLARYLVRDDEAQWAAASALLTTQNIFVAASVILELIWLLEKRYRIPPDKVCGAIEGLLEAENMEVETGDRLALAITYHKIGLDMADALHLASSQNCDGLATFDQAFIKAAATLHSSIPVTHP